MNDPNMDTKRRTVVIERLPEKVDSNEDMVELQNVVDSVTKNPHFQHKIDFINVTRHGSKNERRHAPRITKVDFRTEVAAQQFMAMFRKSTTLKFQNLDRKPFARRDLTAPELALQAELRKLSYDMNQKAKKAYIFYRDLDLFYVNREENWTNFFQTLNLRT